MDGPRINGAIRAPKVRCIDPEGEQLGVLDTHDAIRKAEDFGLDLVEVPTQIHQFAKYSITANSNMKRRNAQTKPVKSKKLSKSKKSSCVRILMNMTIR